MSHSFPRLQVAVFAAVFSVGALTLSGCSAISDLFPQEAARDAATQEISEAGEADVFSLAVGDCSNDEAAEEIDPRLQLSLPHRGQLGQRRPGDPLHRHGRRQDHRIPRRLGGVDHSRSGPGGAPAAESGRIANS